jgi:hypothetical protein
MKKGISPLVSHTTLLAVGVVALMMILVFVFDTSNQIREQSLTSQSTFVAETLKNDILNFYELSEHSNLVPENGETLIIKEIKPNIPEKIAERRYSIVLFQGNVTVILDLENEIIESQRSVNTIMNLNGTGITPVILRLERTNSEGIISDEVRLVEWRK